MFYCLDVLSYSNLYYNVNFRRKRHINKTKRFMYVFRFVFNWTARFVQVQFFFNELSRIELILILCIDRYGIVNFFEIKNGQFLKDVSNIILKKNKVTTFTFNINRILYAIQTFYSRRIRKQKSTLEISGGAKIW